MTRPVLGAFLSALPAALGLWLGSMLLHTAIGYGPAHALLLVPYLLMGGVLFGLPVVALFLLLVAAPAWLMLRATVGVTRTTALLAGAACGLLVRELAGRRWGEPELSFLPVHVVLVVGAGTAWFWWRRLTPAARGRGAAGGGGGLLVLTACVVPALGGCGVDRGAADEPGVEVTDSAGVEVVRNLARAADTLRMVLVEELRIGGSEVGDHETFHIIRGIATDSAGRIFVIDDGASAIRLFDAEGGYVRTIGRRGSGPGEFSGINLLKLWRDTVYAVDARNQQGAFFDTAGALLGTYRSMRGDMTMLQPLAGGPHGWIASSAAPLRRPQLQVGVENRNEQTLRLIDPQRLQDALASEAASDSIMRPIVSFTTSRTIGYIGSEGATRGVFGNAPLFDPTGSSVIDDRGHVYVTPGWPLVVDVYDSDGTHVRRITRAHDSIPVTDALIADVMRRARAYYDTLGSRGESPLGNLLERAKMPRVGFVPVVSQMRVSGDGWLWLRRRDLEPDPVLLAFSAGAPPPPACWDVFDPDGRYRYTLRMPDRFTPHAVAADHVVGVQRDELDVEHVVRYAIRPAT